MKALLIYSPQLTQRLRYILDFLWNTNYTLTDSLEAFKNHIGPKICYAYEQADQNAYWIVPIGLLQQESIVPQSYKIAQWQGLPMFFQTNGDLSFDIFSASFYLLSRYEEYLPHEKDQYGRFSERNAIAYKEKFLHIPLIDLWFQQLEKKIQGKFPDYEPTPYYFQYIPTFDIDVPFAFLNKYFYVQIAALTKNILYRKSVVLRQQIATWRGKMKDPFDNFSLIDEHISQYGFQPIFFFPVAKKHGKYDKNPPLSNIAFQQLIKAQSKKYEIGIHPSWQSGNNPTTLQSEKNYLEKIADSKITKSRQHYIRIALPETYRTLIDLDIKEDYSMGYGNMDGFRASTSKTFFWFDLIANQKTQLQIHPFCWMDATAYHHTKERPESILNNLQYYLKTIQNAGGQMITIMHNNYFAPTTDMLKFQEAMLLFWENSFPRS